MATFNCATAGELEAAAAADAVGDIVNINANITATVLSTELQWSNGVTFNFHGYTVSGYRWRIHGANYSQTCTINGGGGTIDVTGCGQASIGRGAVVCSEGLYSISDITMTGVGSSSSVKIFEAVDVSSSRCQVTMTNVEVHTSANDCVSTFCASGTANSSSWLKAYNCHFRNPGSGTLDNCLTGHNYFAVYMYGGQLSGSGGGPMVNCGPANQTCELYGVAWDWTGHSGTNSRVSALVGCTITGDGDNNTGGVAIVGSNTKSTVPGIACWNTVSCSLYRGSGDTTLTNPHVIYGNTLTRSDCVIADETNLALGTVIARNTIAGPVTSGITGINTRYTGWVYNNTVNVPSSPSTTVYPLQVSTPHDATTNSTDFRRCSVNPLQRSINYCVRSDGTRQAAVVTETIGYSTVALAFGTATNDNSRNDGTNPNAYEIGSGFACDELKALPAYGLEGWDYDPDPPDDITLYYGLFPPTMTGLTVDSDTEITVSYTNANASATDHRIERATDSGFTTGLTTFDVSAVASGAATYQDTTCAAGTTYYYRVRAKNGLALSIPSASDSDTTTGGGSGSAANLLLMGVG